MNLRHLCCFSAVLALFSLTSPVLAAKVPIAGVSTNETDNPKRSISSVSVSPDGQTLAIVSNLTSGSLDEFVFTVPIAGGTPTPLTSALQGDVDHVARFTPDGSNLIFVANSGVGFNQFYKVPVASGSPSLISSDRVSTSFRLTSDGQNILYISRPVANDILKRVPLTGGAFTQLSAENDGDLDRVGFALNPNEDTVFFATDAPTFGANETSLFSVPFAGGSPATLITFPVPPHIYDIDMVEVSPDGNSVLFIADYTVNNQDNIHSIPIGGGTPTEVVDLSLLLDRDIRHFAISPDSQSIAFSADLDTVGIFELYIAPLDGSAAPIKVSDPITAEAIDLDITGDGIPDVSDGFVDGSVSSTGEGVIAWMPDSRKVLYVADGDITGAFEVYLVANPFILTVPGDYNGNGIVDAADYSVWRDHLGQTFDLLGENPAAATPGMVDLEDFNFWKQQFGQPPAGSASLAGVAVPEPTTSALLLLAAAGGACTSIRIRP